MQASKPIVAVGPEHPLEDEILMADYFRKHQPEERLFLLAIVLIEYRWC